MTVTDTPRVSTTVPLDWKEVWFTNCPMVSANNVDQELGWCREEFKKIGVEYAYFRHAPENNWYPHYIHNLDNLIRMGGLYPPIHVNADIRRTVLLGTTWVYEGGCMAVRARDPLFRMAWRSVRPCGPWSATSTAVGSCFGSALMANPKRTSCMSGIPTIIPKVRRSRRIWTSSLCAMARNRDGEKLAGISGPRRDRCRRDG